MADRHAKSRCKPGAFESSLGLKSLNLLYIKNSSITVNEPVLTAHRSKAWLSGDVEILSWIQNVPDVDTTKLSTSTAALIHIKRNRALSV